jgi:isopenicillin N synthase-like dioxygenase
LTILAEDDVGGLEVKRKTDGEWIRVKPTPDAFIINIGDIIQVPLPKSQYDKMI